MFGAVYVSGMLNIEAANICSGLMLSLLRSGPKSSCVHITCDEYVYKMYGYGIRLLRVIFCLCNNTLMHKLHVCDFWKEG